MRAVTGLGLLYVVLLVVLRNNEPPPGEFFFGVLIGLLYALLAFGLILVYRATRIINFAQAEMGSVAALLGFLLIKVHHFPYLLAFAIAIGAAVVSGALVEVLIIRRFARASRLVLSVATIGVGLLFGLVQFYLPSWLGAGFIINPTPPKTPFSGLRFTIRPLIFDGNAVIIFLAVALVVVGLTLFFKKTDIGMAVRAAAENSDRAKLLGISTNRLSLVVWILAAVLSGMGVFLRIPIVGLPVGADIGPQVLLYALAAAVIARMESFTVALAAGVGIGVTEQCLYFFSHDPNLSEALMLPVLLVAMLSQRVKLSRGQDSGFASWSIATRIPTRATRTPSGP